MANLYILSESLQSVREAGAAREIQAKYSHLLKQIDSRVKITVIGRKDERFWKELITLPLEQKKVLDPKLELPINDGENMTHLAVLTIEGGQGRIYGNAHDDLDSFVRAVILKAMTLFPQTLFQS